MLGYAAVAPLDLAGAVGGEGQALVLDDGHGVGLVVFFGYWSWFSKVKIVLGTDIYF